MMKLIFFTLFLIPLSFYYYWLMCLFMMMLILIMLFNCNNNNIYFSLSYFLGLDNLSYWMVMLTIWICFLMILGSSSIFKYNYYYKFFNLIMVFMMFSLFMLFMSMNMIIFYIFFEISLVPILILILGWGYQPERLEAGFYLFIYTILASLPMMISIFFIMNHSYSLEFLYLFKVNHYLFYILTLMVFLIKMPMYLTHLWLPKAHVEASVAGSMILAGIMLKMGGYGLIRLMYVFSNLLNLNMYLIIFSMFSSFWVTLICLRQVDMKSLIAYSSVSHMGLVLCGILTMTSWGFSGALIIMVAHGLCSSGLFCLANMNYERLSTRNILLNKGLINIIPSLSLWWFLFSACNMSAPPSLNLLGEIFLIISIMSYNFLMFIPLMMVLFFSGAYSLYLYSYSQHGSFYLGLNVINSPKMSEFLLLILHWLPLNLLILKGSLF
uniref:NADH-ubiquinone oxidoreductase chain 4 n=1 Tax=Ptiliidae sp. BMNH 1274726 TaxID=1796538 RepID=A0A126TEH9_9COLE|nr:NADH dehydrogenase subunit 4 [Ptiliidae sp. BMNH 1274726]